MPERQIRKRNERMKSCRNITDQCGRELADTLNRRAEKRLAVRTRLLDMETLKQKIIWYSKNKMVTQGGERNGKEFLAERAEAVLDWAYRGEWMKLELLYAFYEMYGQADTQ